MRSGSGRLSEVARVVALGAALVAALGAAPAAPPSSGEASGTSPVACAAYGSAVLRGHVPSELEELSGLAASRIHPGLYWAHNDSGNAFELYGIDLHGTVRARFPLRGAEPRDVEDVAVGPCTPGSATSCVYLGDVGDNRYRHPDGRIYRVAEPEVLDGRPLDVEVLRFRWPDGPRNVEAMVVEPGTARVFLWTKEPRSLGVVHRIDFPSPGAEGRAVAIREIHATGSRAGLPTGADVHPAGDRILIRTYDRAFELARPGAKRLEDVLEAEPVPVPAGRQRQSEAIAYSADGRGYVLATEGTGGPIYAIGCADRGTSRSSS